MFRPRWHIPVLILLLAVPVASPWAADVRIGLATPLSGPYAASGERNRVAVMLALGSLNQAGGVLGRQASLVAVDDGCDAERAPEAALELIKAGVVFVVGHMCSHASLVAAPVYEAAGVPMMSPDSTHPRLTEEGRRNVFRIIGRDDAQGSMAGDWLAAYRPAERIGIAHDGSTYGHGLAQQVRAGLREHGLREALFIAYAPGQMDYAGLVHQLRSTGIDVLYLGGYGPEAGRIVREARQQGSRLRLIGGDGLGMEEFWAAAGTAGEGTVFTSRRDLRQEPAAARVLAAFRAMGLGPLPSGLAAYAAVEIWAAAATRAGIVAPDAVTRTIQRGRFTTVIGAVAFDAKGDLMHADWQWQVWRDGSYAPLQVDVAVREPGGH